MLGECNIGIVRNLPIRSYYQGKNKTDQSSQSMYEERFLFYRPLHFIVDVDNTRVTYLILLYRRRAKRISLYNPCPRIVFYSADNESCKTNT